MTKSTITFKGKVYNCREVYDPEIGDTLTVAPTSLMNVMDYEGEDCDLDQTIWYYLIDEYLESWTDKQILDHVLDGNNNKEAANG